MHQSLNIKMEKQRKPLSTRKPPIPLADHKVIEDWMDSRVMPGIKPLIAKIDGLINDSIPNLQYAIKWGNAFYGTKELGWVIEVAAYHVSVNIVFLSGANFDPPPPLGTDNQTRYLKLREIKELEDQKIVNYITQAGNSEGWK